MILSEYSIIFLLGKSSCSHRLNGKHIGDLLGKSSRSHRLNGKHIGDHHYMLLFPFFFLFPTRYYAPKDAKILLKLTRTLKIKEGILKYTDNQSFKSQHCPNQKLATERKNCDRCASERCWLTILIRPLSHQLNAILQQPTLACDYHFFSIAMFIIFSQ